MSFIQIRNVPEDLHARLKARAALSGQTLSDYLLAEISIIGDRPPMREWLDDLSRLPLPSSPPTPAAEVIRSERAA